MKQKFAGFFGKRLIPCLIVAAMFGAFAEFAYIYIRNAEVHAEQSEALIELRNYITSDEFRTEKDDIQRIRFRLGLYSECCGSGTETAVFLRNADNSTAVDSSEIAGVLYKKDHDTVTYYSNDAALIKQLRELYQYSSVTGETLVQPEIQDIYVQGNEFRCGVIQQYTVDYDNSLPEAIGEPVDLTPADTDGWEHITADSTNSYLSGTEDASRLITFLTGIPSDSYVMKQVHSVADWDADDSTVILHEDGSSEKAFSVKTKSGDAFSMSNTFTADNTRWNIYLYTHSTVSRYLHPLIIFGWIALLIGSFVIAWLWAKLAYSGYQKAYEAAEYRRSLTGALAHDLKSPLTAISGYAENIRDGIHTEKQKDYADKILQNTKHMDALIADVLQLASLEQSTAPGQTEETDLTALAKEILPRYADRIEEKGLSVQCSGTCSVKANRAMLSQALENLIDNAVKFTPESGSIDITGTGSTLTLRNDIPADTKLDAEALTQPFVKGSSARTARTGSGLGLSIVRQITELHKFTLKLECKEQKFTAVLDCTKKA